MIIEKYKKELFENDYVIIPNVLCDLEVAKAKEMFLFWKKSIPNLEKFEIN